MQLIGKPPAPRLEIRDLRLVLALAASGSTARAGELLHLTQPAISRALLSAEARLGAKLFERTARGLVVTAAGARLVDGASRLLGELGELEHQVRAPVQLPTRLRLVCECYTAYHWLPTALRQLRAELPDLDVVLAVEHTREPVAALVAGEIDIALLTTAAAPPPMAERKLFADEVVFVMAPSHPLAARRALTPADLRAALLITAQTPLAEQRWFLRTVFGRARPKLTFQRLPLTEAILDVTRAGMGVAILSEWIAAPHLGAELVTRRLSTGPLHRPWRLAWRPSVAAAIPRLWSALEHTVPKARLAA